MPSNPVDCRNSTAITTVETSESTPVTKLTFLREAPNISMQLATSVSMIDTLNVSAAKATIVKKQYTDNTSRRRKGASLYAVYFVSFNSVFFSTDLIFSTTRAMPSGSSMPAIR